MGQTRYYRCCFTPVGGYFFGGEKNFPFGPQSLAEKKEYYIRSEDLPSQATIFGAIRFMLLDRAGLLDNGPAARAAADPAFREKQDRLIGREGFSMSAKDARSEYGILKGISPLFLYDRRNDKKMVPAPLNHHVKADSSMPDPIEPKEPLPEDNSQAAHHETYAPLHIKKLEGVLTDQEETYLPEDFRAKSGLTDGFLILDGTGTLVKRKDVIGIMTQTRIARGLEEGGLFKMDRKYLKDGYSFCVMAKVDVPEDNGTPDGSHMPFYGQGIVFMGMGRSVFRYEVTESDRDQYQELEKAIEKIRMTDMDDISVYYAASDCYMGKGVRPDSMFWILQKKDLRTLKRQDGKDYQSSMKKSRLYQMIRAGSVFYVRKDEGAERKFLSQFNYPGLRQIGFNHIIRTGGGQ